MAAYGKMAQAKVKKTMEERKQGTLRSGSGKKVTSRKQAIAIGLCIRNAAPCWRGREGPGFRKSGEDRVG